MTKGPLLFMVISSVAVVGSGFEYEERASRLIVYKTIGDVELKLHVFEPAETGTNRPAIVFFFGGGWKSGTPKQFYPHCDYFTDRGMVAVSAEYRVKSRHGTTPFECVEDGKSAVRWIRANAAELGVDPDRIAAGGGSAGGHVAACTALIEGLEAEDAAVPSTPNALVLFNPVADTTRIKQSADRFGGRETEISPAHHVRSGLPPTIIFHGTADETVPFESVERFRDRMLEAGNRCELVAFEGKGHGFFNKNRDETSFDETIRAADAFLVSLGWLQPGEPSGGAETP